VLKRRTILLHRAILDAFYFIPAYVRFLESFVKVILNLNANIEP